MGKRRRKKRGITDVQMRDNGSYSGNKIFGFVLCFGKGLDVDREVKWHESSEINRNDSICLPDPLPAPLGLLAHKAQEQGSLLPKLDLLQNYCSRSNSEHPNCYSIPVPYL